MVPRAGRYEAGFAVAGLATAHLLALFAYLLVSDGIAHTPRYLLYPIVWIAVAAWVALRVRPRSIGRRGRAIAASVGVVYLLTLLWVTGHIGPGTEGSVGLSVSILAPGWGPLVFYDAGVISFTIVPFQFAGYLALAYLVAITIGETSKSLTAGALGLASCVSCTWPLIAALAGATSASWLAGLQSVTATATSYAYDLSTLLFLASVALLLWALTRQGALQD